MCSRSLSRRAAAALIIKLLSYSPTPEATPKRLMARPWNALALPPGWRCNLSKLPKISEQKHHHSDNVPEIFTWAGDLAHGNHDRSPSPIDELFDISHKNRKFSPDIYFTTYALE